MYLLLEIALMHPEAEPGGAKACKDTFVAYLVIIF